MLLRFITPFFNPKLKNFPKDSNYKEIELGQDYLEVIKKPKHGYGKNLNPCIDCKIFMLKKAKEIMKKEGFGFIATGEVLGQRPMSQKKDTFRLMEKEAGLSGLIVRSLSAKLLAETLPEKEGLVDRNKLLDIQGRSRKVQFSLAESLGIKNYFTPSGGCLLTDPGFSARLKDLIDTQGDFSLYDIELLKLGRHFRLSKKKKFVVSRSEKEALGLLKLNYQGIVIKPKENSWIVGVAQEGADITEALSVFGHYARKALRKKRFCVELISKGKKETKDIECSDSLAIKPL